MENDRQKKQRKAWVARKLAENPNYFKELGRKGGSVKSPDKGFGSMAMFNKEKHRQASIKGGINSNKKKIDKK